jgi:DNA-binding response OmpR family regulator
LDYRGFPKIRAWYVHCISPLTPISSPAAGQIHPLNYRVGSTMITNSMRVALVENDRSQAELLSDWLSVAGHRCSRHAHGQTLVRALAQESFDALILGNLPDMSGVGVLKRVRRDLQSSLPVLFVTAGDGESDIVTALNQGADDCMVKPVRRMEFLARLEAIARRGIREPRPPQAIDLGSLRIDCQTRSAWLDDKPVHLTAKDFDLSVLFLQNIGRLLSRGRIREAVWGPRSVSSRTLDTHVCRIRNRLRLMPHDGWRLTAVYGHGYCLRQVVLPVADTDASAGEKARRRLTPAGRVQLVQPA